MSYNEKQHVPQWLAALLKIKKASGNGWPHTIEITTYLLALEKIYGRHNFLAVLDRMAKADESSFEQFEVRVEESKKEHAKEESSCVVRDWLFAVPIQMEFESVSKPEIVVLDQSFAFWNAYQVLQTIGAPKGTPYDLRFNTILRDKPYQSYIVAETKAKTFDQAWKNVDAGFDTLLGLIEFTLGFGSTRFHYGFGGSAHTEVPRPKWLIHSSAETGPRLGWFETDHGDYEEKKTQPLALEIYNSLVHNGSSLKKRPEPGSTHALIVAGLSLYGHALDGRGPAARLLGLWQVAETLTLSDRFNGDTKTVCDRLTAFEPAFELDVNALRYALSIVADKRNDLVHRGIRYGIEDDDTNILKLATESLLYQLNLIARDIPTKHVLDQFYRIYSKPDADIAALRQALRFVKIRKRHFDKINPST